MWIRAITFWDSANYLLEGGEAAYRGTLPGLIVCFGHSSRSRQVLYNRNYESFENLKRACETYFAKAHQYAPQLRTQLTENLQIIGH